MPATDEILLIVNTCKYAVTSFDFQASLKMDRRDRIVKAFPAAS
jgi:hypothetical protein